MLSMTPRRSAGMGISSSGGPCLRKAVRISYAARILMNSAASPVGMRLSHQTPVRRLHLDSRDVAGQAQDLVCIVKGHGDIIAGRPFRPGDRAAPPCLVLLPHVLVAGIVGTVVAPAATLETD
jgi:hypothetical protein